MKNSLLSISLLTILFVTCRPKTIEKCSLEKVEFHERCDRDEYWSGINARYYLVTDSANLNADKINDIILSAYNDGFSKISEHRIQEKSELIELVKAQKCHEGFNFYSIVSRNEDGILELSFEAYYVDRPDANSSTSGYSESIVIDLNKAVELDKDLNN